MLTFLSILLSLSPSSDTIYLERQGVITEAIGGIQTADNNAEKINAALKKFASASTIFMLPAGTIWFNQAILIPDNCTLYGSGSGSTLSFIPGPKTIQEGLLVNENFNLGNGLTNNHITLKNFTIAGNGVSVKKGNIRGLYLNKVSHVLIDSLIVLNTKDEGIRIDASNMISRSSTLTISNCYVEKRNTTTPNIMVRSYTIDGYNSTMIGSRISDILIKDNISIGGQYGVCLFNADRVRVEGNICIANLHRGIIASPTCSNVVIKKNRIDSAGSTGIHLAFSAKNVLIDSNHVTNTLADMSGKGWEGQGIKAYVGFDSVIISNNICYNNATDGIALEGDRTGKNFIIRNNILISNNRNGIRILAGKLSGTNPAEITNGNIVGNKLTDNKASGIYIRSNVAGKKVRLIKISDNTIKSKHTSKKVNIDPTFRLIVE